MEDDEEDKSEEWTRNEGGDEKEWWGKDREEGYTSECDCVDWDWDDKVQERKIGYTGKKSVVGNILDREEEAGVGDVKQQENKEDASDDPDHKEQDGKKKGNSNHGKRKLPTRTLVRTKK
jgi:hypothetical protein